MLLEKWAARVPQPRPRPLETETQLQPRKPRIRRSQSQALRVGPRPHGLRLRRGQPRSRRLPQRRFSFRFESEMRMACPRLYLSSDMKACASCDQFAKAAITVSVSVPASISFAGQDAGTQPQSIAENEIQTVSVSPRFFKKSGDGRRRGRRVVWGRIPRRGSGV